MKIKVNVKGKPVSFDFGEMTKIEELEIDRYLKMQTEILGFIGINKVHKQDEVTVQKHKLKETYAKLYVNYKSSGRKYTEKHIDSLILSNTIYVNEQDILDKHYSDLNLLDVAYDVIKEKKEMLIQVSSNQKIDKKMATNWEKRLQAMEQEMKGLLKNGI